MTEEILNLETKMAYQEDLLEQLNQVIIEQQNTIDKLQKKMDSIIEYLKSDGNKDLLDTSQEVPPPHF